MLLQRKWLAPPVDWEDSSLPSGLSREDNAVLLARGTPRRFRTLFSNTFRLPPGYALESSTNGKSSPVRTWSALRAGSKYLELDLDERASQLRSLHRASVRRQSEGKRIGLLLSGGYDSALLAALMAQDGVDLRCYTMEAPELYPSEWSQALKTASRLRIPVTKITVTLHDLMKSVTVMRSIKRTPNVLLTTAHLLAASRAAYEDHCDLVMLGTGSDELFGPSAREIETIGKFERRIRSIGESSAWSLLLGDKSNERTELLHKGNISPFAEESIQGLFPDLDIVALLEDDVVAFYRELHAEAPGFKYESLTLQLELEMRSSDVLMHELTTASRANGMPVAFPFYDQAIAELAVGTALEFKVFRGYRGESSSMGCPVDQTRTINKYLLRYAFKELIPNGFNESPTLAHTSPFSSAMNSGGKKIVLERIMESSSWGKLGIDRGTLTRFMEENCREGSFWRTPLRFWLLYQLSVWEDVYA